MKPVRVSFGLLLFPILIQVACSSEGVSPSGTGGIGGGGLDGASSSGGSGASGAGTSAGGGSGGSREVGGTASGGASGGVGSAAGGATSGGSAGASMTTGGAATGGAGVASGGHATGGVGATGGAGATGGQDGSGGGRTATASAGCGKSARPDGGKVYVAGQSWLLFPEGYDGQTPFPVLFAFHGCGGGNRGDASRTEYTDQTAGTAFESDYVRAIPLSTDSGGCWNYGTDIARVKALYDEIINDYCVDVDRVFATGHSSGSQFIVQLLLQSHTADAEHLGFAAVAPVAASDYGPLGTPTPVMYIQNQFDQERQSDGKDAVDRFVAANQCESTSSPIEVMGAGCNSGGTTVDPGCIRYDGCEQPTIWCSHNDPQYSGTGHGIPCFAAKAIGEFFQDLP